MKSSKKLKIDELKKLMQFRPTLADTAGFFDCSEDTISRFIKSEQGVTFSDFREKHFGLTRIKLRQKALQLALAGEKTLLVFLLKNFCGMRDNPDLTLEQEDHELVFIDKNGKEH